MSHPRTWPRHRRYTSGTDLHANGHVIPVVHDNWGEQPAIECHSALEASELARRLNGQAPAVDPEFAAALGSLLTEAGR